MTRAICIDIDNVVAQTDEVMREVIRLTSKFHVDLRHEDIVCFDYWKCRDSQGKHFDKNEWDAIHEEFTHGHLARIQPYPGVREHLARLRARFEIHLATSRLDDGRLPTREWLAKFGIPFDELHFTKPGLKHLLEVPFVAAIDDDREQAYAFAVEGVRAFLLEQPWNNIGPGSAVQRGRWPELAKWVMDIPG